MDKKKSVLNITASICSRAVLLVAALLVRRLLIQEIGNDVNGLDSLYSSIIGMLAVAELGVGRAIVYSMYRPIVEGDQAQVAALYGLYKRLYRIIGTVIFTAGLVIMPFLPGLIGDYRSLTVNVYSSFLLTLIAVTLSYLYSAKTSLIEAHKDNYITTLILGVSNLLRYILQIFAILLFASYTVYLLCQILGTLVSWGLTEVVVRKRHGDLIRRKEKVLPEVRDEVVKNTKAMFMHRIGNILVTSIDSLVISGFIGVMVLGKFTNYTYLGLVVGGTVGLFFTPVTSVVGHLCAAGHPDETKKYFDYFYCMNYVLGVVSFLGYYAVIDEMVRLCFGPGLEVSRAISFIITVNQFMNFMRRTTLLFRDASGSFYYDRWRPLLEGVVNFFLSLLFVIVFPEEYKVVGVIIATIITSLTIVFTIEPHIVFKYAFQMPARQFYIRNYSYIGIFVLSLVLLAFLMTDRGMVVNGCISVTLSLAVLGLVAAVDRRFRHGLQAMLCWGWRKLRRA